MVHSATLTVHLQYKNYMHCNNNCTLSCKSSTFQVTYYTFRYTDCRFSVHAYCTSKWNISTLCCMSFEIRVFSLCNPLYQLYNFCKYTVHSTTLIVHLERRTIRSSTLIEHKITLPVYCRSPILQPGKLTGYVSSVY